MTYNKLETEAKHLKQYDKESEKANSTGKMKYLSEWLALNKKTDQNWAEMKGYKMISLTSSQKNI